MSIRSLLIGSLLILLASCSGGDDSAIDNDPGIGEKEVSDVSGDAAFSFIDISKAKVEVTLTEIVVTIELMNIPSSFNYASSNVPDNTREYTWGINFDVNGDGLREGDIIMDVSYIKLPRDMPSRGSILSFTSANVSRMDNAGVSVTVIATADAEIDGNKLILKAYKESSSRLNRVKSSTPFRVIALYNSAGTDYWDSFPDGYPANEVYYTSP